MAISRLQWLKLLGLAVGCAAKFVTGSLFVFNVYQGAIKETFNYTQKEVELMSSMLNLGLGVGFLPGMIYDRVGPQWTSAAGLVVSVSAYLLLWSTTKSVKFYSKNSWLMAIYFFMCGLGSIFTYMVALNTNVINFDNKRTATIVGILNAFFSGSPSVFAVIYYHLFDEDFAGFMLLFAISFGIIDVFCILFLKVEKDESPTIENVTNINYKDDDVKDKEDNPSSSSIDAHKDKARDLDVMCTDKNEVGSLTAAKLDLSENPIPLKQILLNVDYHILVWLVACASCIGLVYGNNITVISSSVRLDQYDDRITIIIPITTSIISALAGFISDQFQAKLPRLWIVIFGSVCFVTSQVLVLLFAHELAILVIATILVGFGIAILWSLSPAIMKEKFYVGNLGRNWGIVMLIAALLGWATQEIYGTLYDDQVSAPNSNICYGMACFRGGTIVCIALASASIVLGIVMQLKTLCCGRCLQSV